MKKIEFETDQRTIVGEFEKIGDQLWAKIEGETFVFDNPRYGADGAGGQAASETEIKAPMPGKIIKVKNGKDSEVGPGDVVVVMEAMKMEYALEASVAGKVCAIHVEEGQTVGLGEVLAEIDPRAVGEA